MRVVEIFENVDFSKEVFFEFLIELRKVDGFDSYIAASLLDKTECQYECSRYFSTLRPRDREVTKCSLEKLRDIADSCLLYAWPCRRLRNFLFQSPPSF